MNIRPSLQLILALLAAPAALAPAAVAAGAEGSPANRSGLFDRTNLFARCVVPYDAKKRQPEERAAMLERLGFKLFAYDYRAANVPSFDAEMDALERHHIQLLAWWFPTSMNDEARLILDLLKRRHLHPQLWVMGGGAATQTLAEQQSQVARESERIRGIAVEAAKIGSVVGLYNHGGWFGEPKNQIAIIKLLRAERVANVGIVYNQHHGHGQIDRFDVLMRAMKHYLLAVNLNGMVRDGDQRGLEILPVGQGDLDLDLLRIIAKSGWRGPVGLLNHTDEDAEARLEDNLDGLDWLVAQLDGQSAGPKPVVRTRREAQPGEGPPRPVAKPVEPASSPPHP
jgi:sugar phosphate isomerase/epimerase